MKLKTNSKTNPVVNFKSFNVLFEETPKGLKVSGVFGAPSLNSPEDKWVKLNSRNFARALNLNKLIIK